jgi:hypothetical protein
MEHLHYCPETVPVDTVAFTADPLVVPDPEVLMAYAQEWIGLQEAEIQNY